MNMNNYHIIQGKQKNKQIVIIENTSNNSFFIKEKINSGLVNSIKLNKNEMEKLHEALFGIENFWTEMDQSASGINSESSNDD